VARRIATKTILLQVLLGREAGVSDAALRRLGLDPAHLEDPDATVPEDAVYGHLEAVAERVGEGLGGFVVALARQHRTTTMGLPGFAMRTAATLRDGLAALHRYQHLTNTLAHFDLVEHDAVAVWSEQRFGPPRLGQLVATEVSALVAVQVARELCGEDLAPLGIELRRPEAPPEYAAFCRCPVGVAAPRGAVSFPRAWLARPLVSADPDMSQFFQAELARRVQTTDAVPPVVAELRSRLGPLLLKGTPSIDAASAALGLSGRTLQRRLQAEGTTFAEVVDDVRRDLAAAYLQNPSYTGAEVAFMLGYAEASSFHRAFKRWTGLTPEAFRARSPAPRSESGPAG
jgi:AraC-like DNA-binding protein